MQSIEHREWLSLQAEKYAQNTEAVAEYLNSRGGLDAIENTYLLGVVANPEPAHVAYTGRLSIPYVTPSGVVTIRFRCMEFHDCKEDGHNKYLDASGSGTYLYNVAALRERHPVIAIAEGEIDAMVCDSFVMPCLGVSGSTKWKPFWRRLFDDYEKVFVIGDGDDAGHKFAKNVAGQLSNGIVVLMPDGQDVNDVFAKRGAPRLTELILGNTP